VSNALFTFLHRSIFLIFILVTTIIVGLNIFFSRGYHSASQLTPPYFNVITLILAVLLLGLIYKSGYPILNFLKRIPIKYAVPVLLAVSVYLQLTIVELLSVNLSWDFGEVVKNADIVLQGGELSDYFTKYPNNIFLVCILAVIGSIFTPDLETFQYFNIFVITLSHFLIFRISYKVAGHSVGLISLFASVLYFPYIFYAPIVYTDTISLIFLLIPLNLLIRKDGTFKDHILTIIAASTIFSLGILLKGSLIIFVIAFSLILFLYLRKWKKILFLVPFLILFLLNSLFNLFIYENGIIDKQKVKKYSFPVTHWLMMGQNEERYGKYAAEDVILTDKLLKTTTKDHVKEVHINELKKRIKEKGLSGNIRYSMEKLTHTWTDGTFYSLNKLRRLPEHPENYKQLMDFKSGHIIQSFARIQHLLILVGIAFFAIRTKERNEFYTFSLLSVIGFFFFFILWEARSRYLVSLTPLLIMISCVGYSVLLKQAQSRTREVTISEKKEIEA
jgi:hypothetical protein